MARNGPGRESLGIGRILARDSELKAILLAPLERRSSTTR